jgi:predicted MPP superfamily phosphohydrolase
LHGTLRVTTHQIQLANDAPLPRPLVIAFASDFHSGPTTHPALFSAVVAEITRRQPDVLLLGGDYVSSKAEHVDSLCENLARCQPPLGKYAVLGNHDLWAEDATITRQLNSCGVEVLVNRNRPLPAPFECISVCGIDDPWTGRADTVAAFRDARPVRIFLSHSPDGLLLLGEQRFDLGFAGHTHGGQIALRDGTPIVSAGGPLARTYGRGRFEIDGHGPMIVSRGVGCSNVPLRINADPEVVICELRGAD